VWKRILIGCVLVLLGMTVNLTGISGQSQPAANVPVVISGQNIDLLKAVAPSEAPNASAACSLNVLKVAEAKGADGKLIPELAGQLIYYLPTKSAEPVMLGAAMQGKKVTVSGKLFMAERAFLVEKVEVPKAVDANDDPFVDIKAPKGTGIQAL
jgi:hypothetical protein